MNPGGGPPPGTRDRPSPTVTPTPDPMYFRMLHDEASGAMSYLLADLGAGEAVIVDPRVPDLAVLRAMLAEHRLRLRWVLRTHEHDAKLPRHERLAPDALPAPQVQHRSPAPPLLPFGDEHLAVLATPGHTAGCLSFRWRDRLFCGDLLAVGGCAAQPAPASPEALWDSVTETVFALPAETLLFAAHAREGRAASTVFEERRWHPWFGHAGRDEFLARVAAQSRTAPPSPSRQPVHP